MFRNAFAFFISAQDTSDYTHNVFNSNWTFVLTYMIFKGIKNWEMPDGVSWDMHFLVQQDGVSWDILLFWMDINGIFSFLV